MKPSTLSKVVLACLALGAWMAGAAPAPSAARSAIEKSLPYLEREGVDWLAGRVPIQHGRGCVSCHHVGFAVWGHREAARAGIATPSERIADLERRAMAFVVAPAEGQPVVAGQLVLARSGSASPEALLSRLTEKQQDDGSWRAGGQFPTQLRPIAESDAVATMWTILAQASIESPDADTAAARERAVAWLGKSSRGETTEWLLLHMLVTQALRDSSAAEKDAQELLERQNDDGGWAWSARRASDALSTGQVLYALGRMPDSSARRDRVDRAVAWLVAAQRADGSWEVPSRLTSAEPSAGKDRVYTYWGTAWASIGLSRTLQ